MGCKYACVCGANCLRCSQYEPEEYFGHAEDVLAQTKGFSSDDEWRRSKREEEEYYARMEQEQYDKMYEEYCLSQYTPEEIEHFTNQPTEV